MDPKLFTGLAVGAVASLVLAIVSHGATEQWTSGSVAGARLFPDLASTAKNAKTIKVTQGDTVVTMTEEGGNWIMKDRGGFGVNYEKIQSLMLKMASAEPWIPTEFGLAEPARPQPTAWPSASNSTTPYRSGSWT